jgi:hypothetical protein
MKFSIYIISIALLFSSCCTNTASNAPVSSTIPTQIKTNFCRLNDGEYTIIIIDSCEYIGGWGGAGDGGPFLTHKGDCKNPIHAKCVK